ncbi:hypothetical protein [Massilia aerilata]|uniref:Uncharacterized protein n=1 Tax=Massilia aerilata TaxID=453817 RepID=A0ABW0RTM5_9BURK
MHKNDFGIQLDSDSQVRRPLVLRIAQDLRLQHPSWPDDEILAEAKAQTLAQLHGKERIAA